jgi:Carboxypeptidase regulatory-like domain
MTEHLAVDCRDPDRSHGAVGGLAWSLAVGRGGVARVLAAAIVALAPSPALAQRPLVTVAGAVRDSAGAAIPGAEVVVSVRRVTTNAQGRFQVDSLRAGSYLLTVRMIGYLPVRARIELGDQPLRVDYVLARAPGYLEPLVVEGHRTGIYGTVGDSALQPLAGVKVQVAGPHGGRMITDSAGHFAFPLADRGEYLVRLTMPGYAERRLFLELKRGEGRELGLQLYRSAAVLSRFEAKAEEDLGLRLAMNLSRERLGELALHRYGGLGLCDIPQITEQIGRSDALVTVIVNGTWVMEDMPVRSICSWGADEVELVEFGSSVCRDVTRTLSDLVNAWCTGFPPSGRPRQATRSMAGGGARIRTQSAGSGFVVIWEKR